MLKSARICNNVQIVFIIVIVVCKLDHNQIYDSLVKRMFFVMPSSQFNPSYNLS